MFKQHEIKIPSKSRVYQTIFQVVLKIEMASEEKKPDTHIIKRDLHNPLPNTHIERIYVPFHAMWMDVWVCVCVPCGGPKSLRLGKFLRYDKVVVPHTHTCTKSRATRYDHVVEWNNMMMMLFVVSPSYTYYLGQICCCAIKKCWWARVRLFENRLYVSSFTHNQFCDVPNILWTYVLACPKVRAHTQISGRRRTAARKVSVFTQSAYAGMIVWCWD